MLQSITRDQIQIQCDCRKFSVAGIPKAATPALDWAELVREHLSCSVASVPHRVICNAVLFAECRNRCSWFLAVVALTCAGHLHLSLVITRSLHPCGLRLASVYGSMGLAAL